MLPYKIGVENLDSLRAGEKLGNNEIIKSKNGAYTVVMQNDGNVVLYKKTVATSTDLWASNTGGHQEGAPYTLSMQSSDNHLVVYDRNSKSTWYTGVYIGTNGDNWARKGFAVIDDDGNFVVYDGNRIPMWSSGTYGGKKSSHYGLGIRHRLPTKGNVNNYFLATSITPPPKFCVRFFRVMVFEHLK